MDTSASTEQMAEGGSAIIYQVVGLLKKVATANSRSRKPIIVGSITL